MKRLAAARSAHASTIGIDMRAIQAFVLVAEMCSFRVAAQAMYADPSTVSRLVRKFEVAVGAKLLLRSTRSVELSAAGSQALPHARRMLESAHELTLALAGPVDMSERHQRDPDAREQSARPSMSTRP
jgi:DNA-binding transcriptional LysR family regulator